MHDTFGLQYIDATLGQVAHTCRSSAKAAAEKTRFAAARDHQVGAARWRLIRQYSRVEEQRLRAIELVRGLMSGGFASEAEDARAMSELERLVPDPHVSAIIFWPGTHHLARDYDEDELTPELVVELAMKYKPIAL